jgi:hypothetical protein
MQTIQEDIEAVVPYSMHVCLSPVSLFHLHDSVMSELVLMECVGLVTVSRAHETETRTHPPPARE